MPMPKPSQTEPLPALFAEIRACTVCAAHLPLGPRPIIRAAATAKLMIIGQAPGTRVHESGIPWDDRSGARLRDWLQIDSETFYDEARIAIMPMGFCYPGTHGALPEKVEPGFSVRQRDHPKKAGGDLPPRLECAPLWHDRVLAALPEIGLTLLVGQYAQARYLAARRGKTLTETVSRFAEYLEDGYLPLPHPSWRTQGWQKKNPWFNVDLLPVLRRKVHALMEQ